jgi:hypothetical protein
MELNITNTSKIVKLNEIWEWVSKLRSYTPQGPQHMYKNKQVGLLNQTLKYLQMNRNPFLSSSRYSKLIIIQLRHTFRASFPLEQNPSALNKHYVTWR